MTRTIKFRGKRIDNGEWVFGYYFKTPLTGESTGSTSEDGWSFLVGKERHCISQNGAVYEVDPNTIGQYTGANDTNNNEIYEGDIVNNIEDDRIGVVAFGQLPYGFHQAYYIDWKGKNGQWLRKDLYFWKTKIKVVGNIYDSQEDNIND